MNGIEAVRTDGPQFRAGFDATHYTDLQTNSDGSFTITPKGTAGVVMPVKFGQQDGIILQFPTGEAGRAFNMTLFSAVNPDGGASGRKDWVMRWGYNIAKGGGRQNAAEHAIGIEFENFWYQAGSGYWTEFHAAFTSKVDGGTRRLWSWLVDVNVDNTCQMYFQSKTYEFRSFAASGSEENYLALGPTKISAYKPIYYSLNNSTILYGWLAGAEGGDVPIVKVNTLNQIEMGATTYPTFIPKTIQIGAGAGETGANLGIWGRKIGQVDSIVTLNNASTDAGTGVVIECGWGDPSTKTRFGMKNGNTFIIDTWNGATWTNQLTAAPTGVTVSGDLTVTKKNGTITLGAQGIKQWVGNGAGAAGFGANTSPAAIPGSTYAWLKWVLDDGTTVFTPVWK